MSLKRDDRFGLEHFENPGDANTGILGRILVITAIVALASLTITIIRRHLTGGNDDAADAKTPTTVSSVPSLPPRQPIGEVRDDGTAFNPIGNGGESDLSNRQPEVRKLLMRLNEAENSRNIEMAVQTIETIRSLPGSPAADIDDKLARQLGKLNMMRLFSRNNNRQWVTQVTVKRNHSASMIASESGSTLASLERLNGGRLDTIRPGQVLMVMKKPRFALVVHRRMRIADLSLNGKFFKRYDLIAEVTGVEGHYRTDSNLNAFWKRLGIRLSPGDKAELKTLLPNGVSVMISEI